MRFLNGTPHPHHRAERQDGEGPAPAGPALERGRQPAGGGLGAPDRREAPRCHVTPRTGEAEYRPGRDGKGAVTEEELGARTCRFLGPSFDVKRALEYYGAFVSRLSSKPIDAI